MKRVSYAEDSFVTDDGVADALMAYARTLGVVGKADVVQVPGVDGTGTLRTYELLIGPASQISSHDTDDAPVEMDAAAAIARLQGLIDERLPDFRFPPDKDEVGTEQ
jgi:hypothetical protein